MFCARVGDHEKPIYRYLPLTGDLTTRTTQTATGEDVPYVVRETLSCLSHADPGADTTPALLTGSTRW